MNDDGPDAPTPVLTTPADWRAYLYAYGELFLRTANAYQLGEITEEQTNSGWIGHEPATEETVRAAEERLGVRFPPSYRAFLRTSDGWDGIGGWVDLLWSCEQIRWTRDSDQGGDLLALYRDEFPDAGFQELFERALTVAEGEDLWLIDPTETGPDGEWPAYLFEPKYGELKRFAGFVALVDDDRRFMADSVSRDAGGA